MIRIGVPVLMVAQSMIQNYDSPHKITAVQPNSMKFDNFDTSLWDEIQDAPGEIFDPFEDHINRLLADPVFVAEIEASNAQFDRELAEHLASLQA